MTEEQIFRELGAFFIRGDAAGAMKYMEKTPELGEYLAPYADLFGRENYMRYDVPHELNGILLVYQRYFRDVFYLGLGENEASAVLLDRLRETVGMPNADEIELSEELRRRFEKAGYHFLGGKTNGHYGPYVWKTTTPATYTVELTDTVSKYTVNILSGFIMRSWMDYLTFGEKGTGGWTSPDGTINCVESAYDFESEKFKISLLKHEARHAEDMKRWKNIEPWQLEYRAKLTELVYTSGANLLQKFMSEADGGSKENSHAYASARIAEKLGAYAEAEIPLIQQQAKILLEESTSEMEEN